MQERWGKLTIIIQEQSDMSKGLRRIIIKARIINHSYTTPRNAQLLRADYLLLVQKMRVQSI